MITSTEYNFQSSILTSSSLAVDLSSHMLTPPVSNMATSMLSSVKDLSLQTLPSLSVSQSLYTELINSVHGSIGVSSQTTTQELTTIITTSDGGIIPDEGNDPGL
jgi:hypothetical protein